MNLTQEEIDDLMGISMNGPSGNIYGTVLEEITALKREVRRLGIMWHNLSPRERKDMESMELRIKTLQNNCYHDMRLQQMFRCFKMICRKCDWEDGYYEYTKDPVKR